ncbi:hypothetical protein MXB_1331 [Myxobolus squamalis]|nr:hypothetical protein MXB_1331 [Myxobolus squamalis]
MESNYDSLPSGIKENKINENDCKKHNTIKSRIPIFKQPVLTKQFVERLKINFVFLFLMIKVSLETVGVCEKTLIGFVQTMLNTLQTPVSKSIYHFILQFSYDFSLEFDKNNDSMIFFAIRYTNGIKEYWDNNNFHNYCIY